MHFCQDEMMAIAAVFTVLPVFGPWLKAKIAKMKRHCCVPEHSRSGPCQR